MTFSIIFRWYLSLTMITFLIYRAQLRKLGTYDFISSIINAKSRLFNVTFFCREGSTVGLITWKTLIGTLYCNKARLTGKNVTLTNLIKIALFTHWRSPRLEQQPWVYCFLLQHLCQRLKESFKHFNFKILSKMTSSVQSTFSCSIICNWDVRVSSRYFLKEKIKPT